MPELRNLVFEQKGEYQSKLKKRHSQIKFNYDSNLRSPNRDLCVTISIVTFYMYAV